MCTRINSIIECSVDRLLYSEVEGVMEMEMLRLLKRIYELYDRKNRSVMNF